MGRIKLEVKRALGKVSPRLLHRAVQANRSLQFRLRQRDRHRVDPSYYYPQQRDCQISNLAYLYSHFLGERESGVFVEVGANDGVFVSNSWGLAARNWKGVMVEPVPNLAEACRRNHRTHPGVIVVETAIGDGSQSEVTLSLAGAYTTASPGQNREYGSIEWSSYEQTGREITVPVQTLDDLLESSDLAPGFDVLVVDVEGYEAAVFSGFDVGKWRPKMMIIELADTHPQFSATRDADASLGRDLSSSGYVIVYKDAVNTVFVRNDIWEGAFDR